MLRLMQVEEIEQLLLQLPRIVELQAQQPVSFVARATIWMDLLEQWLTAAQAEQVERIATLRSGLVFARHTVARDAATQSRTPRAQRLARDASAALVEAGELATSLIEADRPRFAAATDAIGELLARARLLNAPAGHRAADVRRVIDRAPDLAAAYAKVEQLVGEGDAQILLSRALSAGREPPAATRR